MNGLELNTESPLAFISSVVVIISTVTLNAGEMISGSELLTITGKIVELIAFVLSSLYLYWMARGKYWSARSKRVKAKKDEIELKRMEEDMKKR